jgi:diketogulonate reductase-like aldo/keto reductase
VGAAVKKNGLKREEVFLVTRIWFSDYGEEKALDIKKKDTRWTMR